MLLLKFQQLIENPTEFKQTLLQPSTLIMQGRCVVAQSKRGKIVKRYNMAADGPATADTASV